MGGKFPFQITFVETLFYLEIFDESITSYNKIKCFSSPRSSQLLSDIAKKVTIKLEANELEDLEDDDFEDEDNILEGNDESITHHLRIEEGTYL